MMRVIPRLVLLGVLLSFAPIACVQGGILKKSATEQAAQPAKPQAVQANALRPKDTLVQHLKSMDQVEDYYGIGHHGHFSGEGGFIGIHLPLDNSQEYGVVERLLDSRRVLLVLQGLAKLPKKQAAQLVSQEIMATLPAYTKAFDAEIEKVNRTRAAQKIDLKARTSVSGISYQVSNNKDGTPTIVGLRMKLLALCLIAGNLELRQARPAMIELTRVAMAQRALICDEKKMKFDFDRMQVAHVFALYIRVILATGLDGTDPHGMKGDGTAWDWVNMRFPLDESGLPASYEDDIPHRAMPIQNDKYSMNVWVHRALTDAELESLLPSRSNGDGPKNQP